MMDAVIVVMLMLVSWQVYILTETLRLFISSPHEEDESEGPL